MSMRNRAAQFALFAALTGYDNAVQETARLTGSKRNLTDEMILVINEKLRLLSDLIADRPKITITHFVPDAKKSGGSYFQTSGIVKEIDEYTGIITMEDQFKIDQISDISGEILKTFEN